MPEKYTAPQNAPSAIIVDLDGTLAWMNGRGPFDWHLVGTDIPNRDVIDIVGAVSQMVDRVVFMSGRNKVCRVATLVWLNEHVIPELYAPHELYMRADGDFRQDAIVKTELFDTHVRHRFDVRAVFDDRQQVVDLWRSMGLTCLQVAPGNF